MKTKSMLTLLTMLIASVIAAPSVWAKKKKPEPAPLTEAGQKLEADYAQRMEALKAELIKALPSVDEAGKTAFMQAREAESAADAAHKAAQQGMGDIKKGEGLVAHAKGKWIGSADKGIAEAKKKLAAAKTDTEKKAAQEELASWEKNREEGLAALKERQAFLDAALARKPQLEKALADATEKQAAAKAATLQSVKSLGLASAFSSDKLDGKLAKYMVMMEATPHGLAAYAQQGEEQQQLIEKLLSSDELLVKMAVADGAAGANYGRSMEILRDIAKASDKKDAPLDRLALAVALEHATPIKQRNAVAKTDAPEFVDPVKRYLHFEQAFLGGELDPAFRLLDTWSLRMVVNGEEPEEILTWGREMLRNYRPDHITMDDYRWRYVALVRSDIRYGSQDNQFDQDELQFFQNILKNGGICGRRAFIGRFILRAFGIPTTARPQPGHAALTHWTPDGWVVCLGGGWGIGNTKGRYGKDLDFLANTQARMAGEDEFMAVKRAQWIGDVADEPRAFGFHSRTAPEFWYAVSLYTQKDIIAASDAKTLAAVGEDIGEANVTKEKIEITKVKMTDADLKPTVSAAGVITLPATATSNPTKSTGKIIFMDSVLGGKQLHYSRNGGGDFEYTFDAPAAGKYELTAKVVTPSWQQNLMLTANGAAEPVKIPLPFTVGMWDETKPVTVELKKGENTFRFTRLSEGQEKGFSIKEFKLTPTSGQVSQVR